MARYKKKKDFGLGKATAQEKATAQRMADMAKGKPSARNNASTPNKLSAAMYNWAKANMSKLKSPTAAQKKIFEKYKAMVKAGDNPANPKPKAKSTKQAAIKTKPKMPGGSTRAEVEKSFNKAKAINNFVGPGGPRTREDLKRSESEYNKSKPKKPKRSDFRPGRAGSSSFSAAMRRYRKSLQQQKKPVVKRNRRGRRI